MRTVNISLPDALGEFVQTRVREGGYKDPNDYFKELVEADQARRSQEHLEALLLEGVRSETSFTLDRDWYERKRAALIETHSKPPKP